MIKGVQELLAIDDTTWFLTISMVVQLPRLLNSPRTPLSYPIKKNPKAESVTTENKTDFRPILLFQAC